MKRKRAALLSLLGAAVLAAAVAALLFIRFAMLPEGEIFHWLSFDGIETYGDRYDVLPLAVIAAAMDAVGSAVGAVLYRRKNLSASLTVSALLTILSVLFLLAGLRFF